MTLAVAPDGDEVLEVSVVGGDIILGAVKEDE